VFLEGSTEKVFEVVVYSSGSERSNVEEGRETIYRCELGCFGYGRRVYFNQLAGRYRPYMLEIVSVSRMIINNQHKTPPLRSPLSREGAR
jgi:hypothetical protein